MDSKKRRKPDPPKEEAEGKKRMPEKEEIVGKNRKGFYLLQSNSVEACETYTFDCDIPVSSIITSIAPIHLQDAGRGFPVESIWKLVSSVSCCLSSLKCFWNWVLYWIFSRIGFCIGCFQHLFKYDFEMIIVLLSGGH
ncbi:uncharacterized protein LOC114733724 [Neltuma alba]|uniref:uncharacterized protein LOC114733724 n=1 Tax=Neltuma alba TaxID=207710 RepID=UPI0010A2FA20|nr:uncharacterized protein LOC114733724 [Prosopis alba]